MSPRDDKSRSRGYSREMTPDAIDRRLQIVEELYQLGKFLKQAKDIGSVTATLPAPENPVPKTSERERLPLPHDTISRLRST